MVDNEDDTLLNRREFLSGVTATGAGLLGGSTLRHFGPPESIFGGEAYNFATDIYSGGASFDFDGTANFGIEFFQDVNTDEFQLLLSAYEYPAGSLLDTAEIDLSVATGFDESVEVDVSNMNGFADRATVAGELVDGDDQGYAWSSDGGMYNLASGVGNTLGTVANIHAQILPSLDGLEEVDSPVVFAFQLSTGEDRTLVRQSPPMDVATGVVDDPVTVPTAAEQFPSLSDGVSGQFTRSEQSGQYVMYYNWGYDGKKYGLVIPIHKLAYGALHNTQPRFVTTAFDQAKRSPYGRQIGEAMFDIARAEGRGEEYAFNLVRTFAQTWPYERDQNVYGQLQYPNFAEEALVEGVGDCVDKTMIMTSVYSQPPFNYEMAMVFPPRHLAPAVAVDDIPVDVDDDMTTVEMDGTEYVYVESTSVNPAGDPSFAVDEAKAMYDERWRNVDHQGISETVVDYFQRVLGHK